MKNLNIFVLMAVVFLSWGCMKRSSETPSSPGSGIPIVDKNPPPLSPPPVNPEPPSSEPSVPTVERACLTADQSNPAGYCGSECPDGLTLTLTKETSAVSSGVYVGEDVTFTLGLAGCPGGYEVVDPSNEVSNVSGSEASLPFTKYFTSAGEQTVRVVVYPKNQEGNTTQLHFVKSLRLQVLPFVDSSEVRYSVPNASLQLLEVQSSITGIFRDSGGNHHIADGYFILDQGKRIPIQKDGQRVSSGYPGGGWVVMMAKTTETGYQILWRHPTSGFGYWELDPQGHFIKSDALTSVKMLEWQKTASGFLEVVEKLIPVINLEGNRVSTLMPGSGWVPVKAKSISVEGQQQFELLWQNTDGRYAMWTLDIYGQQLAGSFIRKDQFNKFSEAATSAKLRWSGQGVANCKLVYCQIPAGADNCTPNTFTQSPLVEDEITLSGLPESSVVQVQCDNQVSSEAVKVLVK